MSGEIDNTGGPGQDFERSEGRAYYNVEQTIDSLPALRQLYDEFHRQAQERGRRRTVVRVICTQEVFENLDVTTMPVEVAYPLSVVDPNNPHFLIMLGENVHTSPLPEWPEVFNYWRSPNGACITPLQRVQNVNQEAFAFTQRLSEDDAEDLFQIWRVFGWTREGITSYIQKYNERKDSWFAGVRQRETNQLVSACMGAQLEMPEVTLIEGTEYGTLPGYEGNGFCTASVSLLHAQMLQDTLYTNGEIPLITSEFDMTSRSDVVGRHAGMVIPLLEGHNDPDTPLQVLSYNVSVLDRHPANSIRWRDLGERRHHFREAYRTTHGLWRNFIVGVLPYSSIQTHYSPENTAAILAHSE